MATEPTLRHLFGETPTGQIDVSSVIRRSRARRAPRILGAGALALVTVSTLAFGGFAGLSSLGGTSASDAGGTAAMEESGDAELWSTADGEPGSSMTTISFCGNLFVPPPAHETGLEITVDFPDVADVGQESVAGTATLINAGSEPIVGTTFSAPMITLYREGTVVWHSFPSPGETMPLDLDPGESIDFEAHFTPAACGHQDDLSGSLRDELPPTPAGAYEVSAAIDVYGVAATTLVGGPPQIVTLK